jgi:hypothetical protein
MKARRSISPVPLHRHLPAHRAAELELILGVELLERLVEVRAVERLRLGLRLLLALLLVCFGSSCSVVLGLVLSSRRASRRARARPFSPRRAWARPFSPRRSFFSSSFFSSSLFLVLLVLLLVLVLFLLLFLLLLFLFFLLLLEQGELEVPLGAGVVGLELEALDVALDRGVEGLGVELEVAELVLGARGDGGVIGLGAVLEGLARALPCRPWRAARAPY